MKLPKSRAENIVVQEADNELLIYDLLNNRVICLNETSAMVYQLCDGTTTIADISNLMSQKLKTMVSEDFVWLALIELKKEGLLDNEANLNHHFAGFSRREMVKKVGLASMIALPLVSSVIAPMATNAQSGCLPPGTISDSFCGLNSPDCAAVAFPGQMCCSGPAVVTTLLCPGGGSAIFMACACA